MLFFRRKGAPQTLQIKSLSACEELMVPPAIETGEEIMVVSQNEIEKILKEELPNIQVRAKEIEEKVRLEEWIRCIRAVCRYPHAEVYCYGSCGFHIWINFIIDAADISGIKTMTIPNLGFEDMKKLGILVCEHYKRLGVDGWGKIRKQPAVIRNKLDFVACFEFAVEKGKEQQFFDELKKHKVSWGRDKSLLFREYPAPLTRTYSL